MFWWNKDVYILSQRRAFNWRQHLHDPRTYSTRAVHACIRFVISFRTCSTCIATAALGLRGWSSEVFVQSIIIIIVLERSHATDRYLRHWVWEANASLFSVRRRRWSALNFFSACAHDPTLIELWNAVEVEIDGQDGRDVQAYCLLILHAAQWSSMCLPYTAVTE
jgi:hypothetical protein